MEHLTIREATLSDYDKLLEFEQGVIRAERPFDPTLGDDPINYYDIKELITAPHIQLLVAEHKNQLVGCGYARLQQAQAFLRHSTYAYLGFMYTDPQCRRMGVNRMIIDGLKAWAVSKGVFEIRLEVYSENVAAQVAYEKSGFSKHIIEMRMGLHNAS